MAAAAPPAATLLVAKAAWRRIKQRLPCLYGQDMDASGQPTLGEIEDRFVELVAGRPSRDEADCWAA
ncbi:MULTISPECIES: hypothetical protein [unclassified Streptomyces]|uniref:hypothetical protein n=1 Tax=unclassified Streptomyces TaxID=2593676 RepID=UPI0003798C4E|nr:MULTISPECIES: hypothetical protein [unclassified Streptomyces]MYT30392.1 hypothetical protein [Streptomyces sp. SID8354]